MIKVRLRLLLLGTCLVSPLIAVQESFGQSENQSLGLVKLAQAETQNSSREAELEKVNQLNLQGYELYQQGKLSEAIEILEEVSEIIKRLFPGDHPNVLFSFNNLAEIYIEQGSYSKAETLRQESLAMARRLFPKDHLSVVLSLNSLGELYLTQGKYNKAEPLFQQALEMAKRLFPQDHPAVALSLNNLAVTYEFQGRYSEAEPLYTSALAIRKRLFPQDDSSVALSQNRLASLYTSQGRYSEAEILYQESLAMRERLFTKEHPSVAASLNNLALLYHLQGKFNKAESFYIDSLEIRKRLYKGDHPDVANGLNNLAGLYDSQGRYPEAEPLLIEALEMRKRMFTLDHPLVASSLNNLAELYKDQGRYSEVEPLLLEALEIFKRLFPNDHPSVATNLNNLALFYESQGRYGEAEPLLEEALAMTRRLFPRDYPDVAQSLNNLAALYDSQGKYGEAESLYLESLAMRRRLFNKDHPDTAQSLNNLALLYNSQGRYSEAESLYLESLTIYQQLLPEDHPDIATGLGSISATYQVQAKYSEALNYLTQAAEIEESILSENLIIGSEKQKKQFIDLFQSSTYRTISFHLTAIPENKQAAELALTTILRRKGRILDAMGQTWQTLRDNLDPESEQLLNDLTDAQTQFASIAYQPLSDDPNERKNTQKLQIDLDRQIKQLETKLNFRNAEFKQQTTPVTIAQVQQAIPANAALIEFIQYQPFDVKEDVFGNPRYAVYVLLPNGEIQWQDLGEASIIDDKIHEFRELLKKPGARGGLVPEPIEPITTDNSIEATQKVARQLDRLLMEPVRAMTGSATHLLLSLDSQLNTLPFAALVDERDKYLVENHLITYLTSGRDLLRLQLNQNQQLSAPLLLANPDYAAEGVLTLTKSSVKENEDSRGRRSSELSELVFSPLPATEIEGAAIKQLIPKFELFTERKASENNLKNKQNQNPEFLHLATHGFFLPPVKEKSNNNNRNNTPYSANQIPAFSTAENPLLRSGLALAGFNQRKSGDEDGVLTALEVTGLNLRGTKLVVTSACETGLGEVQAGEGIYGLRRAFTLAGAQSQLMSLWKVSDEGQNNFLLT